MISQAFQYTTKQVLSIELVSNQTGLIYDSASPGLTATPSLGSRMLLVEDTGCPGCYWFRMNDAQTASSIFPNGLYTARIRDASGNLVDGGIVTFLMTAGDDGTKGCPSIAITTIHGPSIRLYGAIVETPIAS